MVPIASGSAPVHRHRHPAGAVITSAYLQFQTDEVGSVATSLADSRRGHQRRGRTYVSTANNVSARATTDASAAWNPAAWTTVGQAGLDQRTSDLSAIVQEIVARPGWLPATTWPSSSPAPARAPPTPSRTAPPPRRCCISNIPCRGGNARPMLDLDGSAAGTGYATTFTENLGGVPIADLDAVITDADERQHGAPTVTLANPQAGDQLVVNLAGLPAGITVSSVVDGNQCHPDRVGDDGRLPDRPAADLLQQHQRDPQCHQPGDQRHGERRRSPTPTPPSPRSPSTGRPTPSATAPRRCSTPPSPPAMCSPTTIRATAPPPSRPSTRQRPRRHRRQQRQRHLHLYAGYRLHRHGQLHLQDHRYRRR